MTAIIRLGIYLGIGALLHLLFVGAHFDWSNAWTWLWLVGWPMMLVALFAFAGLIMAGIGLIFAAAALLVIGSFSLAGKLR